MSNSPAPPVIAAQPGQPGAPTPDFWRALRGVWLFTWKSQMTWQRLAVGLLTLLALPALILITTSTPHAWAQRQLWPSNPVAQVDSFARRVARSAPLHDEQQDDLRRIFSEEYARAETQWRGSDSTETGANPQGDFIRTAHERIRNRAKAILDERQYAQFETFDQRKLQETLNHVHESKWGRTGPFYHLLFRLYFFVVLPLNCARVSGALIRDELQADTLGFLLTRPLSRARLMIVKYLSQMAWLQIIALAQALLLFAAGYLREMPGLHTLLPLFLGCQFLAVLAWCALGAFFGLLTRRYMAVAMVYGVVVELGIGRIPTNINNLSLIRHLESLLAHNPALQMIYDWTAGSVPGALSALVLATALFLGLSALVFSLKEYHAATEMQK